MANKKITDFAQTAAVGTSVVPVSDAAGTATNKVTLADIAALGGGAPGDGTVTAAKLAANAVTYDKLQNVSATDRLLGRSSAGAGVVEEIACTATGRSVLAAANNTAARAAIGAAAADSPTFTGQLAVPFSTIAAPAITPTGAPSTGIYFTANGSGFSFSGQRQLNTASTGEVAINSAAVAGIGLRAVYGLTNTDATGAYFLNTCAAAVNGYYTYAGQQLFQLSSIAAGVTQSGTLRGSLVTAMRNYSIAGDAGTLAYLAGSEIVYGHATFAAISPTTTNVVGLRLQPNCGTGVVTNMYDLFIAADDLVGSGVATNRWAIYQENAASRSYFAGAIGIGTAAPQSALHVAGVITLAAGTAAAPAIVPVNDTNTGLFFPAADTVGVSAGGVERLRADSVGVTVADLVATSSVAGAIPLSIAEGRLTLVSGNPVPGGSTVGAANLYYTPAVGNKIVLYDAATSRWRLRTFTEIGYSLTGLLPNTNYDVFVFDNNGVLTLTLTQWTSDNVRTQLGSINGITTAGGGGVAFNRRYVGTIRTNASGLGEDSETQKFVWNTDNRVPQRLFMQDTVSHTWSGASSVYRPWRDVTTLGLTRVQFVTGERLAGTLVTIPLHSVLKTGIVGIGVNSTTSVSTGTWLYTPDTNITLGTGATHSRYFGVGFHYLQVVECNFGGLTGVFSSVAVSPTFLG